MAPLSYRVRLCTPALHWDIAASEYLAAHSQHKAPRCECLSRYAPKWPLLRAWGCNSYVLYEACGPPGLIAEIQVSPLVRWLPRLSAGPLGRTGAMDCRGIPRGSMKPRCTSRNSLCTECQCCSAELSRGKRGAAVPVCPRYSPTIRSESAAAAPAL